MTLIQEVHTTYKRPKNYKELPKITSSRDAYNVLCDNWEDDIEHVERFRVLYLSRDNKVIGGKLIGVGGCSGVAVDPKIIFQGALLVNAQGIILAHNHPSGNRNPSTSDLNMTNRIVSSGKLLEIPILDHIIVADNADGCYTSFADEGLL